MLKLAETKFSYHLFIQINFVLVLVFSSMGNMNDSRGSVFNDN